MEPASQRRRGSLTLQLNKIGHVTTIARVAADLGEDADWLLDVANEMEPEDGLIWVYGTGEAAEGVMAFTDFGLENLGELIKIYKARSRPARTID
jgi:hypothetical protein